MEAKGFLAEDTEKRFLKKLNFKLKAVRMAATNYFIGFLSEKFNTPNHWQDKTPNGD